MKWNIVSDSSCDLYSLADEDEDISFSTIPFVISVGQRDYIDNEKLDIDTMVDDMENSEDLCHTSCPAPGAWYEQFEKEGNVVAFTISSNLSGSYNSALVARDMILEKYPHKNIAVIDSRSTGPEMVLMIEKLYELIKEGYDFDSIVEKLQNYVKHTHVVFALSSFQNLIKNGRMSKIVGLVAGKLNIWGVGIGDELGKISIKDKVRGGKKAMDSMLDDMRERGGDLIKVVIGHCQNEEYAQKLSQAIKSVWTNADIQIISLRGLCSFYAQRHGLIIGFQGA